MATLEVLGKKEKVDNLELKDLKDELVHQVSKVQEGYQDPLEHQDQEVRQDQQVHKGIKA